MMFEYKENVNAAQIVVNKEVDEENPNDVEANEEANLLEKNGPGDLYNSLGVR